MFLAGLKFGCIVSGKRVDRAGALWVACSLKRSSDCFVSIQRKGMKMNKFNGLALALALTGALSGCGGGGGGNSDSVNLSGGVFDASAYFGDWKTAPFCALDTFSWTGGKYYFNGVSINNTANSTQWKMYLFNDSKCTSKAGVTTYSGTMQWSQGKVAGHSNVARQAITWTGFTSSNDGTGTGITLVGSPRFPSQEKLIFELVDAKTMCQATNTTTTDSDGYPNNFPTSLCYSHL